MNSIIKPTLEQLDANVAVISTQWNSFITDNLVTGAQRVFQRQNMPQNNIQLVQVPGAYELSLTAKALAETGKFDAIVALGCVIRGGTPHFEYVSQGCNDGLNRAQLDTSVPVAFGVLTVDNVDQAIDRSGENPNNKGEEAAISALEMISILRQIKALVQ